MIPRRILAQKDVPESVKKEKRQTFYLFIINLKTFQNEKEFIHEYPCNGKYAVCDIMFARRID